MEHLALAGGSIIAWPQPFLAYAPGAWNALAPVPSVLHFTSKEAAFAQVPSVIRANVQREMSRNPHLLVKYWGDASCRQYLQQFYPPALLAQFDNAARGIYSGAYRGDICRAAVLYREGGFYMDMDLQLKEPLGSFLADGTGATLMAIRSSNMLLAAAPRHPILGATLEEVIPWYERFDAGEDAGLMGPATLRRGFERFCACGMECEMERSTVACGGHTVQLYREVKIRCVEPPTEACPAERVKALQELAFRGMENLHLKYGILGSPPANQVMGWTRFTGCQVYGCGGSGYSDKDVVEMQGGQGIPTYGRDDEAWTHSDWTNPFRSAIAPDLSTIVALPSAPSPLPPQP